MGGSTQAAQRRAWNDAMRKAASVAPVARTNRRSDRHKKQSRRDRARKATTLESREYRAAVFMDALEEVALGDTPEEEEEYDELEDFEGTSSGSKRKRKAAAKKGVLPKHLRPRSLASILMEESGRPDGVTIKYVRAEARIPKEEQTPSRKFCPVTGLQGIYTDPKSGIPFSNLKALEQIQERVPPWMALTGAAVYSETIKSLRNDYLGT